MSENIMDEITAKAAELIALGHKLGANIRIAGDKKDGSLAFLVIATTDPEEIKRLNEVSEKLKWQRECDEAENMRFG